MAGSSIFRTIRRRGAVLGAVFAYALLLNALLAPVLGVQAVAAALDPLAAAARCDSTGPAGDPVRHDSRHQPDCLLCGPACHMGGPAQGLAGAAAAAVVTPPGSLGLAVRAHSVPGINPPSTYLSDAGAQAPPAAG